MFYVLAVLIVLAALASVLSESTRVVLLAVMAGDVRHKVEAIPGVKHADVEVVFDPQWDRAMMSDAAKLQLGMMW